jgi:hypothetical protein
MRPGRNGAVMFMWLPLPIVTPNLGFLERSQALLRHSQQLREDSEQLLEDGRRLRAHSLACLERLRGLWPWREP